MHDYQAILKNAEGTQLRIFPGNSAVSYRQLITLATLERLINEHVISIASDIKSDFFLRDVIESMVEADEEYLEFTSATDRADMYRRMIQSGVISYGQRVEVVLINGSIIFRVCPGDTDITANGRLDIYIQRTGVEEEIPVLCPDVDSIRTSLALLTDLFTYKMVQPDYEHHAADFQVFMQMPPKLMPHYLEIIKKLKVDPQAWLKNPKWAQETADIISGPYSELGIKHNLPKLVYPLEYRGNAVWSFDLKHSGLIVSHVTISEPEMLAEWHEQATGIAQCIAFNSAKKNIVIPDALRPNSK